MTKNATNKELVIVEAGDKKIELFKTSSDDFETPTLPEGVTNLSTLQIRFDRPGQSIFGKYLGSVENTSLFKQNERYRFHEIEAKGGTVVGFCGCTQLDKTLAKVEPMKYDVHLIYIGDKPLPNGQTFKCFHIFTRLRRCFGANSFNAMNQKGCDKVAEAGVNKDTGEIEDPFQSSE